MHLSCRHCTHVCPINCTSFKTYMNIMNNFASGSCSQGDRWVHPKGVKCIIGWDVESNCSELSGCTCTCRKQSCHLYAWSNLSVHGCFFFWHHYGAPMLLGLCHDRESLWLRYYSYRFTSFVSAKANKRTNMYEPGCSLAIHAITAINQKRRRRQFYGDHGNEKALKCKPLPLLHHR